MGLRRVQERILRGRGCRGERRLLLTYGRYAANKPECMQGVKYDVQGTMNEKRI